MSKKNLNQVGEPKKFAVRGCVVSLEISMFNAKGEYLGDTRTEAEYINYAKMPDELKKGLSEMVKALEEKNGLECVELTIKQKGKQ